MGLLLGGLVGGAIGGIGSLIGGERASDEAMTGYDWATVSPLAKNYSPNGAAANNAIAELLGLNGGGAGGNGQELSRLQAQRAEIQSKLDGLKTNGAISGPVNSALAATLTKSLAALDSRIAAAGGSGTGAGGASNAFNNYLNSTGYKFQLGQGTQAITENAAARGLLNSGATLKGITKYGQNLASTYFDNYLKQLGGLSTQGIQANQIITDAGTKGGATSAGEISNAFGTASGIFGSLGTGIPTSGGGGSAGSLITRAVSDPYNIDRMG